MNRLITLIAGILFGAGLTVSGMSNPQKVLNFLDLAAMRTGGWDPTLLAVFAGALPVMFLAYRLAGATPWFADTFQIPTAAEIDPPLVVGSALFGVGWGMAGLCPGPAVVALALASRQTMPSAVVVLAAILVGVWLATVYRHVSAGDDARIAV